MNFYFTALLLGLGFASLAFGIFISMRIFNIPDITTDGSFTLGGAVTSVLLIHQVPAGWTLPASLAAGFVAGITTGIIHTRWKVNALLSGILVMTALYSVNLGIMQRSTIPLMNDAGIFSSVSFFEQDLWNKITWTGILVIALFGILYWLLQTDFGLAMRATGNNETMMRSLSTHTGRMKTIGLGIANSLVAFSGCLITQLQGYADINMGIGIVILGLGSVIIGEMLLLTFGIKSLGWHLAGVIFGTIFFRMILALTLSWGVDPVYLKLVVALLVLACLALPSFKKRRV
jgi:putative tryptophan/tyrosine transport system permease protein